MSWKFIKFFLLYLVIDEKSTINNILNTLTILHEHYSVATETFGMYQLTCDRSRVD